jgi:glucose-6-phosphate isomerase
LEVERIGPALEVPAREGFPDALGHLVGKTLGELLEAELEGTKLALRDAKRPTSSWRMGSASPEEIGAFVLSWEISTAVAGELLDIDAFDQPGVELGKKIAHGLLGRDDLVELAASYTSQVGTNADAAKLGLSVLGEG